ncbi:MAG: hypothetical protein QXS75_02195, partial [Thermoplasmatales archaeon]
EKIIENIIEKNSKLIEERGEGAFKMLMGKLMNEVRGEFSGKEVSQLLQLKLRDFLNKGKNKLNG